MELSHQSLSIYANMHMQIHCNRTSDLSQTQPTQLGLNLLSICVPSQGIDCKLQYLFVSIRMCNEISGSIPPPITQLTASSTSFVGDIRTLINSPNTLARYWRSSGCPNKLEAAFLISGCMFFKKN